MQDVLPDAQKLVSLPPFPSLPQAMVQLLAAKILTITPAEAQAFLVGTAVAPVITLPIDTAVAKIPAVPQKQIVRKVKARHPLVPVKQVGVHVPLTTTIGASIISEPVTIELMLILRRAGIKATANWEPAARRLRVRAGSTAMLENRESLGRASAALRATLLDKKILVRQPDRLLFEQDYVFESIMQAAEVVCGYSVNGKQAWRDLTGKPLADYLP